MLQMWTLRAVGVLALSALLTAPGVAAAQSDLERARILYNESRFDEAIAAAEAAMARSVTPSAVLIAERARLERYRKSGEAKDLAAARAGLMSLKPGGLSPQESIEWQVGLATALFLENETGPAAEMFGVVLRSARDRLSAPEYDKLIEWWATTLSRIAEHAVGDTRKAAYASLLAAMRDELDRHPLSRPAIYWAVAAARGAGDYDAAWNAAVAGWVRAGGLPDGGALRADLEKFVTQTLIPERAQMRTGQRLDAPVTEGEVSWMTNAWSDITARWK